MSSPKVALVLYKYKTYSDGKHPIMIRITANRKPKYMATGYTAKPENWDDGNCRLIETRSKLTTDKVPMTNAKAINTDIEIKYNEVVRVKQQVSLTDGVQSSEVIKNNASLKYKKAANFMSYAKAFAQTLMDRKKVRTSKNLTSVLKRIEEFTGGKALLFSDVDVRFLEDYKTHLLKGSISKEGKEIVGVKNNTLTYHFKTIRSILYRAMNETVPLMARDKNPFNTVKMKYTATRKVTLSVEEMDQLRNIELNKHTQQRLINARNYFFFSYNNAGIRITDLILLKMNNLVGKRLYYEMGKTGHYKSILLNLQSLRIIKEYTKGNLNPNDYLFPILSNDDVFIDEETFRKKIEAKCTMINGDLKKLAALAKLDKKLHFHASRHSFSNVARKKKADLYSISKALGHKSIKVTEMYLASFDEEALDETMLMVLGK